MARKRGLANFKGKQAKPFKRGGGRKKVGGSSMSGGSMKGSMKGKKRNC